MAGIFNDLGSGSNVDVCVIEKDRTKLLRNLIKPNEREQKLRNYKFAKGTTAVLAEKIITKEDISKYVVIEEVPAAEPGVAEKMDLDS